MSSRFLRLDRLAILEYALEGVQTRRGVNGGNLDFSDTDFDQMDHDEAEIEKKIEALKQRAAAKVAGVIE